ncbi:Tn7 transposase TnsA N-terminal domain-containing protein [Rhizobacter sp. J219]|uniref:Tn7 transposase TnsA N-terminal domain-containing protein n=1 Tax=Rhizobacter sp. J219 TaxID=2898430 RepID=UPI002151BD55|nr:Tn7 transposase TnsA N-terminal domain-containing protein [Rhizobacter sp. J219]MCR5883728.1 Tn7 transposase TnsA N-terminal domain-containing protein [Rhizobacter sp. J219]
MDEELPPARKVVTRSPARTVRILNLNGILDAPVECESTLERDFVYRAVLCSSVSRIRHQPFQLALTSGRKYTPDFLVTYRSGASTVVEVKLASKVAEYQEIFDQASRLLVARGISFVVLTESHIQRENQHRGAALILRYRKENIGRDKLERVTAALCDAGEGGIPMLELVDHCGITFAVSTT